MLENPADTEIDPNSDNPTELPHGKSTDARPTPIRWSSVYGLGRDIWAGVDAQEYVNRMRDGEDLDAIA